MTATFKKPEIDVRITPKVAQSMAFDLNSTLDWLTGMYVDPTHPEILRCRRLLRMVETCTERTSTFELNRADARDLLGHMDETGRGMPNGSLWTALQNVMEGIQRQL